MKTSSALADVGFNEKGDREKDDFYPTPPMATESLLEREKFEGNIEKIENWGLLHLSYIIKKNKKGNYIHFKIKGSGKTISELEKNEKLDKSLLRFLTVKVKKFDLKTNYFEKKSAEIKEKSN